MEAATGDIIRVAKVFLSADEFRISFRPGLASIVESIDGNGDASVRFPQLDKVRDQRQFDTMLWCD